jgi:hypothetical protein
MGGGWVVEAEKIHAVTSGNKDRVSDPPSTSPR